MNDDPRCCGSGTCIIDNQGRCWCGQQWNGHEMVAPSLAPCDAGHAAAANQVPTPMGDADAAAKR